MHRAFVAKRIACFVLGFWHLSIAAGFGVTKAQTASLIQTSAMPDAVDFNFVGQGNPGASFQLESDRIAKAKGTNADVRSYARLMVGDSNSD